MAHICSDWLDMSLILNQIPPTKHKLRVTIKIEDIIVPTFRGTGDEICYLSSFHVHQNNLSFKTIS